MTATEKGRFAEAFLPHAKADGIDYFHYMEWDEFEFAREKCFAQIAYMFNGNNKRNVKSVAKELAQGGTFLVTSNEIWSRLKVWALRADIVNFHIDESERDDSYFDVMASAVTQIVNDFQLNPAYSECFFKATMYEGFIDNHETDLYVKKTPVSEFIVDHLTTKILLTTFESNTEHYGTWYELPFCHIK